MTRQDGRAYDELRPIKITTDFVKFAEGSCLIECGDTKVLCCASVEEKTPPHVAEGEGWVTAEYSMLPRANRERSKRDISKLKLSPRSAEIQRLVGRSLRAAVDMKALGERTINIDCDVLQGDGGTRTASVTGGFVALALACRKLVEEGYLGSTPIRHFVTGVSAGIVDEQALLDLQYSEDSRAQVDLTMLSDLSMTIDCDVLQGDGGTRTASVTGGFVALALACRKLVEEGYLGATPIRHFVTGVSAGIVDEQALLDLQYSEDSRAQVDLNCVMNELGEIIELQGTGEGRAFTLTEQQELVRLCAKGNRELLKIQKEALGGAL